MVAEKDHYHRFAVFIHLERVVPEIHPEKLELRRGIHHR
jgi:hypothetical protein